MHARSSGNRPQSAVVEQVRSSLGRSTRQATAKVTPNSAASVRARMSRTDLALVRSLSRVAATHDQILTCIDWHPVRIWAAIRCGTVIRDAVTHDIALAGVTALDVLARRVQALTRRQALAVAAVQVVTRVATARARLA